MNENWPLDELSRSARLLAAVDETGSFTRAADRLGLQQSAVSHRIKRLETELGTALFDRTTRRVAATAAGRSCAMRRPRISRSGGGRFKPMPLRAPPAG